jgi:hypothetical protein
MRWDAQYDGLIICACDGEGIANSSAFVDLSAGAIWQVWDNKDHLTMGWQVPYEPAVGRAFINGDVRSITVHGATRITTEVVVCQIGSQQASRNCVRWAPSPAGGTG